MLNGTTNSCIVLPMNDAAKRAAESAGGLRALARQLNVSYQAVQKWLKSGVPPTRVLEVEEVTGISRHELRPDVYGPTPPNAA